jgi:hypothetical protein
MLKPRLKVEITTAEERKKKVYYEDTIVFGEVRSAVLYEKIVSLSFGYLYVPISLPVGE